MKKNYLLYLSYCLLFLLPLSDYFLGEYAFAEKFRFIYIFAILALGLNIITGFTGLLNLGTAGFMALGAYFFAILSSDIYPFQLGFWLSLILAPILVGILSLILSIPILKLQGDYFAIVTIGIGEIIQESLRNLESITKGTQGINPLPSPNFFSWTFPSQDYRPWYYLLLSFYILTVIFCSNLKGSKYGRSMLAIKNDSLAARSMGINVSQIKSLSFTLSTVVCSFAGALNAAVLSSTGEPSNYDFQISVLALCIVIIAGLGNVQTILWGAIIMVGINSIFMVKVSSFLTQNGILSANSLWSSPNNWKYLIFGLALIITIKLKPHGIFYKERQLENNRTN